MNHYHHPCRVLGYGNINPIMQSPPQGAMLARHDHAKMVTIADTINSWRIHAKAN